jgi:hypothetical protein
MEGYVQALIDTHRRKIKPNTPLHVAREIEERISELKSILDYYKRIELTKAVSSFVISCKAKDLSTELRRVCK